MTASRPRYTKLLTYAARQPWEPRGATLSYRGVDGTLRDVQERAAQGTLGQDGVDEQSNTLAGYLTANGKTLPLVMVNGHRPGKQCGSDNDRICEVIAEAE
jgi:hypothetical protein